MFNTQKDFEEAMKDLLTKLKNGTLLDDLSDNDSQALKECIKAGYVDGIKSDDTTLDGKMHFEFIRPFVTLDGLRFIERN